MQWSTDLGFSGRQRCKTVTSLPVHTIAVLLFRNMAHRICRSHFERFALAKLDFSRAAAEMAESPEFMVPLLSEGAISTLKTLLSDAIPTVRQASTLALARMANNSADIAAGLVAEGVLGNLVASIASGPWEGHGAAAACALVRAVGRHDAELADCCIDAGCLQALVRGDPAVRHPTTTLRMYIHVEHAPVHSQTLGIWAFAPHP